MLVSTSSMFREDGKIATELSQFQTDLNTLKDAISSLSLPMNVDVNMLL